MLEKRPFATGSKPGPDEIDHFLEQHGFYRKHVARDSSSLFRVVAEFVLDVQNYHGKVRQACASYMELHRKRYAPEIDQNFFNYVAALRKTRTAGTLLELRVLAQIYRKNIILFEPNQANTQTTERSYVKDETFELEPIRVFYSQKDKHFDVIYTLNYVEKLAESQSIVYDVLYTSVFKLPDVNYAVERMLHDQKGEVTVPLADDESKYSTANGEVLPFDTPEDTCCVLKDPDTCHFHNQNNFEEVVRKNQGSFTIINRSDDPGRLKIYKPTDGYLYDKVKSCVRQLLDENITPFPYKVAKALDPSIYRNTEFEFWQELRKESRLKWQDVEHSEKYYVDSYNDPAYLALDDDLKKKFIYVNAKDDECSKKFGYLTGLEHFRPSRESLEQIVMPVHPNYNNNRPWRGQRQPRSYYNNQRQQNYSQNYSNQQHHDNREYQYVEPEPVYNQPAQAVYQDGYQYAYVDPNSPPPFYQPQPMQPQIVQYIPQSTYPQQQVTYQQAPAYNQPQPIVYPNFSVPPPAIVTYPPPNVQLTNGNTQENGHANNSVLKDTASGGDSMNLIHDNELSAANINWNPKESTDPTGNDLPLNDTASLQFFYNLGVRYYFTTGVQRRLESVARDLETLDIQHDHGDSSRNNNDQPPPVPTNTPVTNKAPNGFAPPGNRNHYNNNNQYNYRRPFNNNNNKNGRGNYNGSFSRKEIQFNSNVKNVHKADNTFQKQNNINNNNGHGQNSNNIQASGSQVEKAATANNLGASSSQGNTSPGTSPVSASSENNAYVCEQPTQNTLPALTMPPPQIQMATYAPQTQYYPQYPVQAIVPAQQGYTVGYQNENGEVVPVAQPYQQQQYPQQYQQQYPQQYQQFYYAQGYPAPQTPVYLQQSPHPFMDQTGTTNDSGVDAVNGYVQAYAPPAYTQYMYPSPTQYYYQQTPIIQTAQPAPVYPNMAPSVVNGVDSVVTADGSSSGSGSNSPEKSDNSGNSGETAEPN